MFSTRHESHPAPSHAPRGAPACAIKGPGKDGNRGPEIRPAGKIGVDSDIPPHALLEKAQSYKAALEMVLADEELLHESQTLRCAQDCQ